MLFECVFQNSVPARVQVNVSVIHLFITILVPFFKMLIFVFIFFLLHSKVFYVVMSVVFIMCIHIQEASTAFMMSVQLSILTYWLGSHWMDFCEI